VVVCGIDGAREAVCPTCSAQVPGVFHTQRAGGVDEHVLPLLFFCFSIDNVDAARSNPVERVRGVTPTGGAAAEPPYGIEP
jgi:hypothetical protein